MRLITCVDMSELRGIKIVMAEEGYPDSIDTDTTSDIGLILRSDNNSKPI